MSGNPYPKQNAYRNPALLDVIRFAPCCMNRACQVKQEGQVVPCHSNSLRHGKGSGLKAHDIPAALCGNCHDLIDGRAGNLTRAEAEALFFEAVYNTWLWLMKSKRLRLVP
ncbi:hypothetical protein [Geothrix sp. 21YS21S-2]|uniref:hypothetical protein n=1 Tax=Geothrix sp. 21YS21S-2 TaxID=3068893 RepID=UPI0027B9B742|nr:hypothetical protein [Geothrix sp. 21YS21S-2]